MPWMKYFCEELTPELLKKAQVELGETEDIRNECLVKMKNLINDEPEFYPCMDDIFLLRFLRVRKFDTEKAFKSLKDYYVHKAQYSGIITDILPSGIKHILDHGEASILEHRDKDGAGVFIGRVGHFDPKRFSSDGQVAFMLIASETLLEVEATQITGYSAIIDFDNFGLDKASHFGNPRAIYRTLTTILKSMPCRIKSYHIVNEAAFVSGLLNVAMHIVPQKLRKRLHFHGRDLKSLHKFISPEILPEEYGGHQGPFKKYAKVFGEIVLSRENLFKERNKCGYRGKTLEELKK